ncbi:MAG: DUF5793 family protein [Haloglomus sp.]
MRRDYFTLTLDNVETADDKPGLHVTFEGPSETLDERLTDDIDEIDATYRLKTPVNDEDATGVLAITERYTGDFLLEVNADADTVFDLVDAAREYGQSTSDSDGCFRVELFDDGDSVFEATKRTLLVYDSEGSLLRQHSLIPSGVEL